MSLPNNATSVASCNQRITALTTLVQPKTRLAINGQSLALPDVIAVYQAELDARAAVAAHRAAYEKAVSERRLAERARQTTDEGLRAWFVGQYGPDSQQASQAGFPKKKVTPPTAATRARAVEKALATREARHTLGKRQKKKIKGVLVDAEARAEPATRAPAVAVAASGPPASQGASSPIGVAASP